MFKLLSLPVSKIQAIVLKMADLMVVINAFLIRRGPACYWWICQRASKPTGHCINQLIIWFCHFILSYICCMIIYCIQTLPESCIFILCCINQFIMFSFSCSLFSRTNFFFSVYLWMRCALILNDFSHFMCGKKSFIRYLDSPPIVSSPFITEWRGSSREKIPRGSIIMIYPTLEVLGMANCVCQCDHLSFVISSHTPIQSALFTT